MREDQQHWKTVCFSSAHLFCLPMTSVLSDRVCFLRMPAILPAFPTCPRQPVQLCITLETGAKLFSGNFSAALSDAKKQAQAERRKSASAPVYADTMGTRSLGERDTMGPPDGNVIRAPRLGVLCPRAGTSSLALRKAQSTPERHPEEIWCWSFL